MVDIIKKKLREYKEDKSVVVTKENLEKAENTLKNIFEVMKNATQTPVKIGKDAYAQPEMVTAGKLYDSLEEAKLLHLQLEGEIIDVKDKIKEYLLKDERIINRLENLYGKEGLAGMLRNLSNLLSYQPYNLVHTLLFEREKEKLLQELKEALGEYPHVDFKMLLNLLLERYKITVDEKATEEDKTRALLEALRTFSLEKFTEVYNSAKSFTQYYESNKDKIKDEKLKKIIEEVYSEALKVIEEYEEFKKYSEKNIYTQLQVEKSPVEVLKAHVKFYLNYYATCIELHKKLSELGKVVKEEGIYKITEIVPGTVELNTLLQQTLLGLSPQVEKLITDNVLQILKDTYQECIKDKMDETEIEKIIEELKNDTAVVTEANNKIRYLIAKYINEKSGEKLYSINDKELMEIVKSGSDEELRDYLINKLKLLVEEVSGADLDSVPNLPEIFTPVVVQQIKQELLKRQKQKLIEEAPVKVAKLEAENSMLRQENKELKEQLEKLKKQLDNMEQMLKELHEMMKNQQQNKEE